MIGFIFTFFLQRSDSTDEALIYAEFCLPPLSALSLLAALNSLPHCLLSYISNPTITIELAVRRVEESPQRINIFTTFIFDNLSSKY